jgi:hypothetical protein
MKTRFLLFNLFCCAGLFAQLNAQSVVALHRSGNVQFFNGADAFKLAYESASSGDTLYISGGTFTVPAAIAKKITVFGAGHNPDYTKATGQTIFSGDLILSQGATKSYFEGCLLLDRLIFRQNEKVDDVVFRRCRINGMIDFTGNQNSENVCENTMFLECVFAGNHLYGFGHSKNATISNCIIAGRFGNMNYATLSNCILLSTSGGALFYSGAHCTVQNSIINANPYLYGPTNYTFKNNVFFKNVAFGSAHFYSDNYIPVESNGFFVKQDGVAFSYTDNYNLTKPGSYLGTDGKQVGIYGGDHPWKEGSVPMIPHISRKSISHTVDTQGNLKIEIDVSAQEY